jgi:hypothetical protein
LTVHSVLSACCGSFMLVLAVLVIFCGWLPFLVSGVVRSSIDIGAVRKEPSRSFDNGNGKAQLVNPFSYFTVDMTLFRRKIEDVLENKNLVRSVHCQTGQ